MANEVLKATIIVTEVQKLSDGPREAAAILLYALASIAAAGGSPNSTRKSVVAQLHTGLDIACDQLFEGMSRVIDPNA